MEPNITDDICGQAIMILKTARIRCSQQSPSGPAIWFVEWGDKWDEANLLYRREFPNEAQVDYSMSVFNWLIEMAFRDVVIQRLPATENPDVRWIEEDGPPNGSAN